MKKAILFGASGFIGRYLLEELLSDPDYSHVTIVVRKDLKIEHSKLTLLLGDVKSVERLKFSADEIFIALGTTHKKTPDRNEYYRIDHDYPVLAAGRAKDQGAKSVFLVSSVGASKKSSSFYLRTKGETERDIIALGFDHTHIFRPSMLMGSRNEYRRLERAVMKVWSVIDGLFIGSLDRYRGIAGREVAIAMLSAAKKQNEKIKIYEWREMHQEIRRPLA